MKNILFGLLVLAARPTFASEVGCYVYRDSKIVDKIIVTAGFNGFMSHVSGIKEDILINFSSNLHDPHRHGDPIMSLKLLKSPGPSDNNTYVVSSEVSSTDLFSSSIKLNDPELNLEVECL